MGEGGGAVPGYKVNLIFAYLLDFSKCRKKIHENMCGADSTHDDHWTKFDNIFARYRVWSFLFACEVPLYLVDFFRVKPLRLCKRILFFVYVFYTEIIDDIVLKIGTTLVFMDIRSVLLNKIRKMDIEPQFASANLLNFVQWNQSVCFVGFICRLISLYKSCDIKCSLMALK